MVNNINDLINDRDYNETEQVVNIIQRQDEAIQNTNLINSTESLHIKPTNTSNNKNNTNNTNKGGSLVVNTFTYNNRSNSNNLAQGKDFGFTLNEKSSFRYFAHVNENKFQLNSSSNVNNYNANNQRKQTKKDQSSLNQDEQGYLGAGQMNPAYMPMPVYYYPPYDQSYAGHAGQGYPQMIQHPSYYYQHPFNQFAQTETEETNTNTNNSKTKSTKGVSANEVNNSSYYQYRATNDRNENIKKQNPPYVYYNQFHPYGGHNVTSNPYHHSFNQNDLNQYENKGANLTSNNNNNKR